MAECFLERLCFHGNSSFLYITCVLYHALLILDFNIGKESSLISFLLSRFLHQLSKRFLEVAVYKFKKTVKIWSIDFLGFRPYWQYFSHVICRNKIWNGSGLETLDPFLFNNTWTKFADPLDPSLLPLHFLCPQGTMKLTILVNLEASLRTTDLLHIAAKVICQHLFFFNTLIIHAIIIFKIKIFV